MKRNAIKTIALLWASLFFAFCLISCSQDYGPDHHSDPWVTFIKLDPDLAKHTMYVEPDGSYTVTVRDLSTTTNGPRFVGSLSDEDLQTVENLVSTQNIEMYTRDARHRTAAMLHYTLWVSPGFEDTQSGSILDDFVPSADNSTATKTMLSEMLRLMRDGWVRGRPFNEGDARLQAERDWPAP